MGWRRAVGLSRVGRDVLRYLKHLRLEWVRLPIISAEGSEQFRNGHEREQAATQDIVSLLAQNGFWA